MKRQIRRGAFETNSSSVHSITMCTGEEYSKWVNEEILYWTEEDRFGTREEIIEEMKKARWRWDNSLKFPDVNWENEDEVNDIFSDYGVRTYEEYFNDEWYETYVETYTTPNGEEIVAFGFYGHD